MDATPIEIFVSYSHQDEVYLRRDSLLGFLEGLRHLGVRFWTDRSIPEGARWDEVIRTHLLKADIALLLVSQAFLDSDYIRTVELENILTARKDMVALPILLSPCDWLEHDWLSALQFLPRDGKSLEEDYVEEGQRKRLYSQLRSALSKEAKNIREKKESGSTKKGELRRVAVARCELCLASDDPLEPEEEAEVIQLVRDDFQKMSLEISERFGGHTVFSAPEVMYHFGYPRAYEDTALRSVKAVCELARRVETLNCDNEYDVRFSLRGGVDFGKVIVDPEGRLIGKSIDEAERLRLTAARGKISISNATADLVGDQVVLEPLPQKDGYVLCDAFRAPELHCIPMPPLVGRSEELALLSKRLQRCAQGEGAVAFIRGERGIGKTRLVEALKAFPDWKGRNITLCCSPFFSNRSLYPLVQYFEQSAGEAQAGSDMTLKDAITDRLKETGLDEAVFLPAIAPLFRNINAPEQDLSDPNSGKMRRDLMEALVSWILAVADTQPVLLVLEDAQWADPSSVELLALLVDYIQEAPLMLVVTGTGDPPPGLDDIHVLHVTLSRFSKEETSSMIAALDSDRRIAKKNYSQISYETDGIPLYIGEYIDMLLKGAASDSRETLTDIGQVPLGLDGLLTQRLDLLGPSRVCAELASVIGDEFSEDFYCALADEAGIPNPKEKLSDCIRAEVFSRCGRPGQNRYRFRHGLLRDAAYGSVILRERKRYHRLAAEVMRRVDTGATDPSSLAFHLSLSGMEAEAVPLFHRSAQLHTAASENREALRDLRRGLDLLPKLPESKRADVELSLRLDLGAILVALKGYGAPEMADTYERAYQLGKTVNDPDRLFGAIWGAWAYNIVRGNLDAARELSLEIEQIAQKSPAPATQIDAHHLIGVTHFNCARFREAVAQFDMGLDKSALKDPSKAACSQGQDAVVALNCWKALSLAYLGDFEAASQSIDAALERASHINHRLSKIFSQTFSAIVKDAMYIFEAAIRVASEASRSAEEETFVYWQAWNDFVWGTAESSLSISKTSLDRTRAAIRMYESTGAQIWLPYMNGRFARDLSRFGRQDEAATVLKTGKDILVDNGDRYYSAEVRCFEAEVLLNAGNEKDAVTQLAEAFDIAMKQSHRLAAAHILTVAEKLESASGRASAAEWQKRLKDENGIPLPTGFNPNKEGCSP